MARKIKIGLLGYVGIAGILFMVGNWWLNSFTGKLQYGKPRLKIKSLPLDLSGVILEMSIPITNKNANSVTISRFLGTLWYGSAKMAELDQRTPVTLTGGGTSDYTLEVNVKFSQLSDDIKNAFKTGQYLNNFYLKGNMTVGAITVPIDQMLTLLF